MLAGLLLLLRELHLLVSYIKDNNLPPQLTPEDEAKYINLYEKHGDTDAYNKLVEHNLRLVLYIARKYINTTDLDYEDLASTGSIGLIKAVKSFRSDKGVKLSTYASRCIDNEILMRLRKERGVDDIHLDDPIGADKDGNEVTIGDTIASDEADVDEQVASLLERAELLELVGVLTKQEWKVIQMRYGLLGGVLYTQKEVARVLKISRSYVSRIEKRALEKLKVAIEQSEYFQA